MGGMGSGNRWRFGSRGTCEASHRIDIRYMRKQGLLKPGAQGTLSWSRRGERTGWIEYRCSANHLTVDYKTRPVGGEWSHICEHIPLENVMQPFGGYRQYMRCLGCNGRCMVLYGGTYFRCRKCQNLSYATQNEDALGRLRSRQAKIWEQLGETGGFDDPIPCKPKGMHWKTYDRLCSENATIENQLSAALDELLKKYALM
ncbi:hypothetical protein FB480_101565 [Agrobacterium vitis]|nr:hypothetical protein FB480_101565 [Agrobacterium vitis]